jgi:hypothetical protein
MSQNENSEDHNQPPDNLIIMPGMKYDTYRKQIYRDKKRQILDGSFKEDLLTQAKKEL